MNEEIENRIINFIYNNFDFSHKQSLDVAWMGGEPLLNLKTIKSLSLKFIKLCNENNLKYNSGIVTNGYLLNKEKLEIIKNLGIKKIQVPLDGDKKTHNKRRRTKDNQNTYNRIFENIKTCIYILGKGSVTIRVNVDKTNKASITSLFRELSQNGLKDDVSIDQ